MISTRSTLATLFFGVVTLTCLSGSAFAQMSPDFPTGDTRSAMASQEDLGIDGPATKHQILSGGSWDFYSLVSRLRSGAITSTWLATAHRASARPPSVSQARRRIR